jgi:hypothetical protein
LKFEIIVVHSLSAFHCFQNNVLRIALLIIIKVNIFHLKEELVYGHSGYGGQMAYADPVNNIGIAYLTNDLSVYGFGNDPSKYMIYSHNAST